MWYLKDTVCEDCGAKEVMIQSFRDRTDGKVYIDGATCQCCFKNVILPDEKFSEFVNKFGTRVF